MARNPCTICSEPGIPGLIAGAGKCQYHYNVGQFGKEWADKVRQPVTKKPLTPFKAPQPAVPAKTPVPSTR